MQDGRRAEVAAPHPPGRPGSRKALLISAAAVLAADQATKALAVDGLSGGRRVALIDGFFQLRLVTNPGTAFGLFQNIPMVIFLVNIVIVSAIAIWAIRSRAPAALGLVIGGGLGNLADRLLRPPGGGLGEVVDFLYLSFWPTFNLADAAIVAGVFYLMIFELRREDTPREHAQ